MSVWSISTGPGWYSGADQNVLGLYYESFVDAYGYFVHTNGNGYMLQHAASMTGTERWLISADLYVSGTWGPTGTTPFVSASGPLPANDWEGNSTGSYLIADLVWSGTYHEVYATGSSSTGVDGTYEFLGMTGTHRVWANSGSHYLFDGATGGMFGIDDEVTDSFGVGFTGGGWLFEDAGNLSGIASGFLGLYTAEDGTINGEPYYTNGSQFLCWSRGAGFASGAELWVLMASASPQWGMYSGTFYDPPTYRGSCDEYSVLPGDPLPATPWNRTAFPDGDDAFDVTWVDLTTVPIGVQFAAPTGMFGGWF